MTPEFAAATQQARRIVDRRGEQAAPDVRREMSVGLRAALALAQSATRPVQPAATRPDQRMSLPD